MGTTMMFQLVVDGIGLLVDNSCDVCVDSLLMRMTLLVLYGSTRAHVVDETVLKER